MINIKKGQKVKDNENYITLAPTGDYYAIDLIECAHKDKPSLAVCMFQVQFIEYGNVVYQQDMALTRAQTVELKKGKAMDQVLNNKDLLINLTNEVKAGRIFGKRGLIKDADEPNVADEPVSDSIDAEEDGVVAPVDNSDSNTDDTQTDEAVDGVDSTDSTNTDDNNNTDIPDEVVPDDTVKKVVPIIPPSRIKSDALKEKVSKAVLKTGKKIAKNTLKNITRA